MRSYTFFLGVDISKATFDVVSRTPEGAHSSAQTFANTPTGCAAFCQAFPLADSLMVVEATGGYETALITAVLAAGGICTESRRVLRIIICGRCGCMAKPMRWMPQPWPSMLQNGTGRCRYISSLALISRLWRS